MTEKRKDKRMMFNRREHLRGDFEVERKKRRGKEARFGYSFYLFTQGSRPPLAQTQYRSRFIFYSSLIEFELNLAKVSPLPFFLSVSLRLVASTLDRYLFFSLSFLSPTSSRG